MGRGRLEAFSDAVFGVIITIMVLEIKVPHGDTVEDVLPLFPAFFSTPPSRTTRGPARRTSTSRRIDDRVQSARIPRTTKGRNSCQ
jgi:hypothetical protein